MDDAFRIFAGLVLIAFLGYVGYQSWSAWSAADQANQELARVVEAAEIHDDLIQRLDRYNAAYEDVADVYRSRNSVYRMFFGNPAPPLALALDRSMDQAVIECLSLPFPECLYRLAAVEGMQAKDPFLRDAHRALMVDFNRRLGLLGDALAIAGTIEDPVIRAAAFEQTAQSLHRRGQDEAALDTFAKAIAAFDTAEPGLRRAVETAHAANTLIELGDPARAAALLRPSIDMVKSGDETTVPLDQVLGLLQIASTAALAGDVEAVDKAAGVLRTIDQKDSGPLPMARVEAMRISEAVRFAGPATGLALLEALPSDMDKVFAQMLVARTLVALQQPELADQVLQDGIALSQSMSAILPMELLVEIVGAQAALGYFPAANITLANIEGPVFQQEATSLLARYYLHADRDNDARPLIEGLLNTPYAAPLLVLAQQPLAARAHEPAAQEMARRLLLYFRRGWRSQIANFEQRLADREVYQPLEPIRTSVETLTMMPTEALRLDDVKSLINMVMGIRHFMSPVPVDLMISRACPNQPTDCRIDEAYLRGYAFREYVLPAFAELEPSWQEAGVAAQPAE
jgi:tetratricopeptide (TPR) repeat protein